MTAGPVCHPECNEGSAVDGGKRELRILRPSADGLRMTVGTVCHPEPVLWAKGLQLLVSKPNCGFFVPLRGTQNDRRRGGGMTAVCHPECNEGSAVGAMRANYRFFVLQLTGSE